MSDGRGRTGHNRTDAGPAERRGVAGSVRRGHLPLRRPRRPAPERHRQRRAAAAQAERHRRHLPSHPQPVSQQAGVPGALAPPAGRAGAPRDAARTDQAQPRVTGTTAAGEGAPRGHQTGARRAARKRVTGGGACASAPARPLRR